MRHLHDLGHRRIATITGLLETKPGIDRLRGYRDACRDLGLAYRDEYVAYGDFYFDSGQAAATRLLACDEPPTAIVAASDMMAIGAYKAARERGVRVPEELSIVGFDDMQLAGHVQPPLTTVAQDKAGLGVAAARALLCHIAGADTAEHVMLPIELVARGSTAAPAGG